MADDDHPVQCTFFGTTSVHVSDGATSIFTDAFLSRPPLLRVALGRFAPDRDRISQALARGHVERLDGIFVAHSHHDHAMDAPEVIKQLGGTLYGSESTLNVGRGAGLGEDSLQRIADGDEHTVGDFGVRVFEGLHSPGNRYLSAHAADRVSQTVTTLRVPQRPDVPMSGCWIMYRPQGNEGGVPGVPVGGRLA